MPIHRRKSSALRGCGQQQAHPAPSCDERIVVGRRAKQAQRDVGQRCAKHGARPLDVQAVAAVGVLVVAKVPHHFRAVLWAAAVGIPGVEDRVA